MTTPVRLSGKVALVTGGASGLGKAVAQHLASEAANVVITEAVVEVGSGTYRFVTTTCA